MTDDKPVNVVNKYTGEVMTFEVNNDQEMAQSYAAIQETIKALERAKTKIKNIVFDKMDGDELIVGKEFIWKRYTMQYKNYDLTVMRNVLDEDLFNQLVKPDKPKVDELIKESIDTRKVGGIDAESCAELRNSMIEERDPVTALRLDRIKNNDSE